MTNRPITPGYNKHLDIKFTVTKRGTRRASYWGSALRWLPLPAADAEIFIAQGLATKYEKE
jgi:hypothetical protein